jgi:hypothetical protein
MALLRLHRCQDRVGNNSAGDLDEMLPLSHFSHGGDFGNILGRGGPLEDQRDGKPVVLWKGIRPLTPPVNLCVAGGS